MNGKVCGWSRGVLPAMFFFIALPSSLTAVQDKVIDQIRISTHQPQNPYFIKTLRDPIRIPQHSTDGSAPRTNTKEVSLVGISGVPVQDESTDSVRLYGSTFYQTLEVNAPFHVVVYLSNLGTVADTYNVILYVYDAYLATIEAQYTAGPFVDPVGGSLTVIFYNITGLSKGLHWLVAMHTLQDGNSSNDAAGFPIYAVYHPGTQILVSDWDLALPYPNVPGGGYDWQSAIWETWVLDNLGYGVDYHWLNIPDPTPYQAVWIAHGVFPTLFTLPSSLVTTLSNFLNQGRGAYCEGGDIWANDLIWQNGAADRMAWCSLFGVDGGQVSDGGADLTGLMGLNNPILPWVAGHTWQNVGEDSSMDRLALSVPINPSDIIAALMRDQNNLYNAAIGFQKDLGGGNFYRTIATNFELAFMLRTTSLTVFDPLLLKKVIKQGLGILPSFPVEIYEQQSPSPSPRMEIRGEDLLVSLPFRSNLELRFYDVAGRSLSRLSLGPWQPGEHRISLKDLHLPQGMYFIQLFLNSRYSQTFKVLRLGGPTRQ